MKSPWEEGDRRNRICVLGEAPAKTEMRLGRPLVGPSGDVFNDCLHAAGIARRECYILNIWPFMVTKNAKGAIISPSGEVLWHETHGMTEDGLREAAGTIEKLQSCEANVVLTLGAPALDLLSGKKKPILKWRGSIMQSERMNKKFIPTLHPAATLHGVYTWRYLIIGDMERAAAEASSPDLNLPDRNLIIRPSVAEVMDYFDYCENSGRMATDIEVINHNVSMFSLACTPMEALSVPFLDPTGNEYWDLETETAIWKRYAEVMANPKVMKINQNIVGFDCVFLLSQCNVFTHGPLGDCMIAQSIMYPDFRMGLDFIASVHTREPYWKDEGKVWKANHKIDWPTFQRYCAKDACVALEAWDVLSTEMTEGGYWPTYNMTVALAKPLAYMSIRGLKVDREGLARTKVRLEREIAVKEKELEDAADYSFNPKSPQQCAKYFYEHCGHKPYINAYGGVSTDDKALTRIYRKGEKGSKEAKLCQEIRALQKLKGTYIEVDLDKDNRLRCSWNPRGTVFGRLSSSKTLMGTGMNLQNLHPEFKGFIVAG